MKPVSIRAAAWRSRVALTLILGAGLLLAATTARAGLGDLVKKAKDKAAKAVGQKSEAESKDENCEVEYDDVVVELNDERISRLLKAFEAAGKLSAGRPELVEKLNKMMEERGALWEKHGNAIMELQRKRGDVEVCYHDGYSAAQDRRMREYAERALTDPALLQKYAKAAERDNAAAAKGDSGAQARLHAVAHAEMRPTREDTLQVHKSCGPIPAKLPTELRIETLDREIAATQEEIRKIDAKVAKAQSQHGGFDDAQWHMAIERIGMFLAWKKTHAKGRACKFSAAEQESIEKQLGALQAAIG